MNREEPPLKPLHRRLLHWGPMIAMSIVGSICVTTIYCHLQWWPPERSWGGLLDMIVFLLWNYLCLSNLLQASYIGPGYVPFGWKPEKEEDQEFLQYCEFCSGFKSPRAHHCRQCKRCVMKMDHHCPWINNCCGHRNQGYFVAFLISAVIGCLHATLILGPSFYWALFRGWYHYYGTGREPVVELGLYGILAAMFSFGLAVGVIVAVGFLFCVQMRSILRNKTGIEDYIVHKAINRERDDEFIYPYNLGWKRNLKQVITRNLIPVSNGFTWEVRDGCNQYTLTMEQIEQKRLKRLHAMEYQIIQPYKGGYFFSRAMGGCYTFCSQPILTGDDRLIVQAGDRVLVTGWRRHWMFGEKLVKDVREDGRFIEHRALQPIQRGWFPRRCAGDPVEIDDGQNDNVADGKENVDGDQQEEMDDAVLVNDFDVNDIGCVHRKVD